MANSLLKLTVESSEYDAKLKKAAEGVRHLADVAHKSAGDMTGLEKSTLDYIKSIGEMETKSRTAAGQVRELESTYKELKVIYDQLNDVEKADEGGKALAKSLEQLKQRAQDAKKSLDDASKSLQQNEGASKQDSSALEALASKFTVNIDALKLFNIGLQAADVALDVAKDAFFASEATVDEWGRTMDASKSLYEGFLTALNTGDISGYLNNINDIVTAARQAYDELDRLGTMKTIQSPKMSAQQTENDRMRMMIQTGRYIAPVDGRKASMAEGQQLTKAQIQTLERQLQNGMKTVVGIVGDQVKQTGKAIDAVYNRQAKELGMSVKEFRKGTSSMAEFDKRMEGYQKYKEWNAKAQTDYARQGGRGSVNFDKSNPYAEFKKWGTFRVDGERYNSLVQLIQQRDQQAAQAYGMQSQAYRTMNRANGTTLRQIMGGGGSGSGKGGATTTANGIKYEFNEMEELVGLIPVAEQKVKDLQQQIRESWDEGEIAKLTKELKVAEDEVKRLKDIGKPVDLEKIFPDYSKQNYNTGYAGSTKAKIDSARQDFALSTTNFDTINSYISGIKNALKDADLGSDLYNSLTEQLKDATTMSTMLQELMERGVNGADLQSVAEKFKAALLEGDVPDDKIKEYVDKLNEQIKNAGGIELSYNEKTGEVKDKDKKKSDRDVLKDSKQLVSGLSQVAGGLQQMGVKLPEEVQQVLGVVQGLMTVIEGVNTIIGITQTAALTANTTAMVALTSALWANTAASIIPFANGGIVPHAANGYFIGGTHMSGDVTPIMANAGELVLNRAQQGNLASQLSGGGMQNIQLSAVIRGDQLMLVQNNRGMRTGKGELVQSYNRR